jgi:BirA family transcriptional regulator, biotin operon repressor / biotin---[acetyl-CoA-carboxylase] ligase
MSFRIGDSSARWSKGCHLHCEYKSETTSTNDWAKEAAFSEQINPFGLGLFLTDHQTQGRGRGDHTWSEGEIGGALLSSWVFKLGLSPHPVTSCRIGLAVERALSATWPWLHFSLKAPNDIYLGEKKVAGLLLENLQQGSDNRLIIGLGLNVFSHPALETSTSLKAELTSLTGKVLDLWVWNTFMDHLLLEMTRAMTLGNLELSEYDRVCLLFALNKNPNLTEKYVAVEADGSLILGRQKISWFDL